MQRNALKTIKHGIYRVFGDWSKTPNWCFTPTRRSIRLFSAAVDKSAVLNEDRNVMPTEGVAVTAPPNKKTIEQQFSVAEIQ